MKNPAALALATCLLLPASTALASDPAAQPLDVLSLSKGGWTWAAIGTVVTWCLVRLFKSDTKLPLNVPPRWRAPLAFGVGIAFIVFGKAAEALAAGTGVNWKDALVQGLYAGAGAIVTQSLAVNTARDGREIPVPGLMVAGAAPSPGKPATVPPPAVLPPEASDVVVVEDLGKPKPE